ncbi:AAA family ATPase [Geomonas azotofigens]|uniref:AAA family ATPase n=1 Tax=Geomonas azotofigens TaxID=2843196 RepID=UPI001C119966|nr:AAA family ATPase [Geomonas azotofigens]MBU5614462.1 AAA family ATPase [Geomonas azotofigens]
MIIRALTIENFKGIREPVRVEFKPITLLFGPNSAGKSTIVQALHYARELLERQNVDADLTLQGGEFVDLGGFENLVHGHDRDKVVRLRFDLDLSNEDLPEYITGYRQSDLLSSSEQKRHAWNLSRKVTSAWVEISVSWSEWRNRPFISRYEVGINGEKFGEINAAADSRRVWIPPYINFGHSLFPPISDPESFEDYSRPVSEFEQLYQIVTKASQEGFVGEKTRTLASENCEISAELVELIVSEHEMDLVDLQSALPTWGKPLWIEESCLIDPKLHGEDQFAEYLDEFASILSQLFVGPGEVLRDALRQFRYLGPIRETPPRNHKPLRSDDEARWSSGLAAWDLLYNSPTAFCQEVSDWLHKEDKLNTGYSLRMLRYKRLDMDGPLYGTLISNDLLEEDQAVSRQIAQLPEERQLVLVDEQRRLDVMPQDIGIGISQILPVVVASLDSRSSIVAVEQPELHIHPGLQVSLGDLFISQIQDQDKMFLIETHSEHLLLRFLRRVRETSEDDLPPGVAPLQPEQLSVNYIDMSQRILWVRQLQVSPEGDSLGDWPKGFFEERAGELY